MRSMRLLPVLLAAVSLLLFLPPWLIGHQASASTEVSGGIYQDTVWRKANSPYVVVGDVTLFPGYTLTIEPGVELRFSSGTRLIIRGALVAGGTASDRIVFTSTSPGTRGSWSGVDVATDLGGRASVRFARFSYATVAFQVRCCWSGGPVSIYDSDFVDNEDALGGYAGWDVVVERASFRGNKRAVSSADKVISYSSFENNEYGLFQSERTSVCASTFTGNTVALYGGRGEVRFSQILNNGTGVQGAWDGFTLHRNTITANDVGVILSSYDTVTAPVEYNNVYNNKTYNLKNTTAGDKEARNNWWGTTDSDTTASDKIDASIYDGYDNPVLGRVFYQPILIWPVDTTPTSCGTTPPTPTPTSTKTPTATPTATVVPTPTMTATPTATPGATPTPTPTAEPDWLEGFHPHYVCRNVQHGELRDTGVDVGQPQPPCLEGYEPIQIPIRH